MHERSSRRRRFGTGTIALSLGLCLCAGQLVATQPAVAATPVVTAAKASMRPAPKMTQKVSSRTVKYGSAVKITTKVYNSKTGAHVTSGKVRLQAYRGGWKTWQTRGITKSGSYTFSFKPLVSGTYRTVFLGGSGVRPGLSNSSVVNVTNKGAKVVAEAAKHKGALYLYGASGPKRFDCSGFTMYVYRKATGRKLPHKANSQQKSGRSVSKGSKQAGDLIIFRSGSYGYHAAVYAGGGKIWDSPHSGARVSKRKFVSSNYVVRRLV